MTVYLKDYQPYPFQIQSIDLKFDIQSLSDVTVYNRMQLKRLASGPLILNSEDLQIEAVYLNDALFTDYCIENHQMQISACPDSCSLLVVTKLNPQSNLALSGLYASRNMLCTQCEAEGFRRITCFPDRPDVMTVFTTTIVADVSNFPCLLSNGNLVSSKQDDAGRLTCVWQDPFLKPCYLFALVAGDLARVSDQFITQSGQTVGLDIYVEHGDEAYCTYAMQAIKDAMRWDEERFGREYDLQRYMIVAVKDFNMGAMENKGLNIFNAKYVLASQETATDEDIFAIESVVAHEYFHNWTGNRVTCRDWFQLSLKEGLTIYRDQSFSSDLHHADAIRIKNVAYLRQFQFPEDTGAMQHPVQPKSYEEINNFYTTTIYQKGAEVVRMYEVLLGRAGFRKGMDLYFERHDGQAVRIEEFLQAMSDANQVDLSAFRTWYDKASTPVLEIHEYVHNHELVIEMIQLTEDTPWMIPVRCTVYTEDGQALTELPPILIMKEKKQVFRFPVTQEKLSVNYLQGFSAPIILKRHWTKTDRLQLLKFETDGFALWDLKQQLWVDAIVDSYLAQKPLDLDERLLFILKSWLKRADISPDLLTELFRMPSFEECCMGLSDVDAPALERMRLGFQQELARALQDDFAHILESIDNRAWYSTCLEYLVLAHPTSYLEHLWDLLCHCEHMTLRMTAFRCLMWTDKAEAAIMQFYQDWQHHELVLDKWFQVQASIPSEQTLNRIQSLCQHPKFSWKNPNKVRALWGSFIRNPIAFHAQDAKAYACLADAVLILDTMNPQVAARMCAPFTRIEFLDRQRQESIKAVLKRLHQEQLSVDVQELVSKALAAAH